MWVSVSVCDVVSVCVYAHGEGKGGEGRGREGKGGGGNKKGSQNERSKPKNVYTSMHHMMSHDLFAPV